MRVVEYLALTVVLLGFAWFVGSTMQSFTNRSLAASTQLIQNATDGVRP